MTDAEQAREDAIVALEQAVAKAMKAGVDADAVRDYVAVAIADEYLHA
jgi:hypothetical protein